MIEFFEFLNGCSPLRSVAYLGFLLGFAFLTYGFIESLVTRIVGGCDCDNDDDDEYDENEYRGDLI